MFTFENMAVEARWGWTWPLDDRNIVQNFIKWSTNGDADNTCDD